MYIDHINGHDHGHDLSEHEHGHDHCELDHGHDHGHDHGEHDHYAALSNLETGGHNHIHSTLYIITYIYIYIFLLVTYVDSISNIELHISIGVCIR